MNSQNRRGKTYGNLQVIHEVVTGRNHEDGWSAYMYRRWLCKCLLCGEEVERNSRQLTCIEKGRGGYVNSCGCTKKIKKSSENTDIKRSAPCHDRKRPTKDNGDMSIVTDTEYLQELLSNYQGDECVIYNRNTDASLPVVKTGSGIQLATRLVYQQYKGEIPKGKVVNTTCGCDRCINPLHLTTEHPLLWVNPNTVEDPYGLRNVPLPPLPSLAIGLSDEEIERIYNLLKTGMSLSKVASLTNVSTTTVSNINKGKLGQHITRHTPDMPLINGHKRKELSENKVLEIACKLIDGESIGNLAEEYELTYATIHGINCGASHAAITGASKDNPLKDLKVQKARGPSKKNALPLHTLASCA